MQNITSHTRLLAVLGHPVGHSVSPQMQNAALRDIGYDAVYLAFDVAPERFKSALSGMKDLGFLGCNVTIPHKLQALECVDELTREAQLIGAVNTIKFSNGRLVGHNTDGIGYLRSLQEEQPVQLADATVVVLGAGGAARAIACQLALTGVKRLVIANRTLARAQELAAHVSALRPVESCGISDLARILAQADLLINASSVGMYPNEDEMPVEPDWLHDRLIVSDTVYNPHETLLLREAVARGARIHHGIGMLICQGAEALTYWTGVPAPIEQMRLACEAAMEARLPANARK